MSERIEFVRNHNDLSTSEGFQFEFCCDRCGSGFRTRFKPSATGTISRALDAASSVFGGVFGTAADLSQRTHDAAWKRAHDAAFVDAVNELKPDFVQCPRCSSWVCRRSCWNERRGLCKQCAPDLAVEMAAAQSDRSVEEIHRHARMSDEDRHLKREDWNETIRATCPSCEAPLDKRARFCPSCGASLASRGFCTGCGAELQPGAKFCAECGVKQE